MAPTEQMRKLRLCGLKTCSSSHGQQVGKPDLSRESPLASSAFWKNRRVVGSARREAEKLTASWSGPLMCSSLQIRVPDLCKDAEPSVLYAETINSLIKI